jgi:hypothetical protein
MANAGDLLDFHALSLVFGGGQYVAVGGGGTILTSVDSTNWVTRWSGVDQSLLSVTYGEGRFVAVGGDSQGNTRVILTSTDAVNWQVRELSDRGMLWQVAHGGSGFVTVGNKGPIQFSRHGLRWTDASADQRERLTGVAFGAGRYTAVGGHGQVLGSSDGRVWARVSLAMQAAFPVISYGDRRFVIVGDTRSVWSSPDGTNWTTSDLDFAVNPQSITYGGDGFLAVGAHGFIATSTNGVNWVNHSRGPDGVLEQVAVGNEAILVNRGGELLGSANGVEWTPRGGIPNLLTVGLAFTGNQFVVFGRDNMHPGLSLVLTSSDGLHWERNESGSSGAAYDVIYGGGRFVAVGGGIFTSPDASHWSSQPTGYPNALLGVAYGNGRYVAVGQEEVAYSSLDAMDWRAHQTGTNWLRDVRFGKGMFVAIGARTDITRNPDGSISSVGLLGQDLIVTSQDGLNWIGQPAPVDADGETATLTSVEYGGGWFVVACAGGRILTSSDGTHWQTRNSGTRDTLNSVRYADGHFYAVGDAGTVLKSGNVTMAELSNPAISLNRLHFLVHGEPGGLLRVESSTDLKASNWTKIGVVAGAAEGVVFEDPTPPSSERRFYRALRDTRPD